MNSVEPFRCKPSSDARQSHMFQYFCTVLGVCVWTGHLLSVSL